MDQSSGQLRATEFDPGGDGFFDALQPLLATRADEALVAAEAARVRAANAGDEAGVVRAMLAEGMACDALGDGRRDAVLAEALVRAQKLGDPVLLLRATNSQVVIDIYHGRYADALSRGQMILGLAHAAGRKDLLGRLLNNLATASALIGELGTCIAIYAEWNSLLSGNSDATRLNRILASNNEGEAWWRMACVLKREGSDAAAADAIRRARILATHACEQMQVESHVGLRLSALDTLVSVLLEEGDSDAAREWLERVRQLSDGLLEPTSVHWGMWTLIQARVALAREDADLHAVLASLRAIEALPGPRFCGGEMQAMLHACLTDVLEKLGEYREALRYHRQGLQFEARAQSLLAREHAMAVHRTLESLRGETEEFITHDLRNPLGAALIQLDAALGDTTSQPRRWQIESASEHIRQALDTADRYLTVLRTRHLRRADLKPIDLAELVDDVGERLAPPAGAGVRLERALDWGLLVRGDRISLLTALTDLLRCALDKAPAGCRVDWKLTAAVDHALLTIAGRGPVWAEGVVSRVRRSGAIGSREGRDMAAAMLGRVAQLHDSRIELVTDANGACIEWRFPLAAEGDG